MKANEEQIAAIRRAGERVRALVDVSGANRLLDLHWQGLSLADLIGWTKDAEARLRGADVTYNAHGFHTLTLAQPEPDPLASYASVWRFPWITPVAWHEAGCTKDRLEAAAGPVIEEFIAYRESLETHPDTEELVPRGAWTSLFLIDASTRITDRTRQDFPATAALAEGLPVTPNFGFVGYSGTIAGTHIARHAGSSNLRLRHHLCVEIGNDTDAWITVGAEKRTWNLGKCLAFDDSFQHEVEHLSGSRRVVLIVDTWHPDLSAPEVQVLSDPIFSGFGRV